MPLCPGVKRVSEPHHGGVCGPENGVEVVTHDIRKPCSTILVRFERQHPEARLEDFTRGC